MARMMSVSEEDFHTLYWPKLESAIHLIFQQNPGEFIAISYEETYSAVYKCVCQQHSDKLYDNLMQLISTILVNLRADLESQPMETYLGRFQHIMSQYLQSVEGISAIFNYMNRFYIKPQKHTDLKLELLTQFSSSVADNEKLFELLSQSAIQPFSADPNILMSIVQGLYLLRQDFAERNPSLFSRFIPSISPSYTSLHQEIIDTQQLQDKLSNNEEFSRGENALKRSLESSDVNMDGKIDVNMDEPSRKI